MNTEVTKPADDQLPYTRTLFKPVTVLTATVAEITLRLPTGADLVAAGSPVRIGPDGLDIDATRMSKLIALLAGIPATAVAEMDARDIYKCSLRISNFLLSGEEEATS